jgi:hypothetical protein
LVWVLVWGSFSYTVGPGGQNSGRFKWLRFDVFEAYADAKADMFCSYLGHRRDTRQSRLANVQFLDSNPRPLWPNTDRLLSGNDWEAAVRSTLRHLAGHQNFAAIISSTGGI